MLEAFFKSAEKPVQKITTDDIRQYLEGYLEKSKASKVSLDNIRRILSSFFSWLEEEDYIRKNPVKRIHKIKAIKAIKHSDKTINLSFDEWNVWYHTKESDKKIEHWIKAPHRLEDVYNFEDALVVGGLLITLIKNSDRVRMACLAQLVNVIAPIMTNDEKAWAQTIYYPYYHASNYGRGKAVRVDISCGTYDSAKYKNVPYLDSVGVLNEEKREFTVFVLNRNLKDDITADIRFENLELKAEAEHIVMAGFGLKDANTAEHPDTVVPASKKVSGTSFTFPKASWPCPYITITACACRTASKVCLKRSACPCRRTCPRP